MRYIKFLLVLFCVSWLTSCQEIPEYGTSAEDNFNALVDIVDARYCFFEDKDIDWQEVASRYRDELKPGMNDIELFDVLSRLLDELKDGHVNLSSYFNTSYYRNWWSDFPQDFNLRTLQQYYLGFDYQQTSGISYKVLDGNIGYMYYPSFSSGIGQINLDYVLAYLYNTKALILDIRNNGGGLLTNIDVLVSRFITDTVSGGSITHKTGPGHSEFSQPYAISYDPCENYRVPWQTSKPVYVLTNRSCFSAANDFVAVMKTLPNVKIVGAKTGGGGGLPFSSELPNGWSVRFSACPIYAPDGSITEFGIDPSEGFEMHCSEEDLAKGVDAILDFAISLAMQAPDPQEK